ncbi:uncharacterized protein LOC126846659 isoform X2 [Adelges cooleyi]|uniref:uncharacterized protein LOC126846659 isoform X2 n=1 Tax=Adelges cooleyi TaxID=133065 RepID=UPI00217FB1EF|nr:uncharacterized protein LOC126846659 isoform X2 [Adelges cooleyi]
MHLKSIIFLICFLNSTMQTIAGRRSEFLKLLCIKPFNKDDLDRIAYENEEPSIEKKYENKKHEQSIVPVPVDPQIELRAIAKQTALKYFNYYMAERVANENNSGMKMTVKIHCTYKETTNSYEEYMMNTPALITDGVTDLLTDRSTTTNEIVQLDQEQLNADFINLNNVNLITDGNTNTDTGILDLMVTGDQMYNLDQALVPSEPVLDISNAQTLKSMANNPFVEKVEGGPNSQSATIAYLQPPGIINPIENVGSNMATIPYLQPQGNMNPMSNYGINNMQNQQAIPSLNQYSNNFQSRYPIPYNMQNQQVIPSLNQYSNFTAALGSTTNQPKATPTKDKPYMSNSLFSEFNQIKKDPNGGQTAMKV